MENDIWRRCWIILGSLKEFALRQIYCHIMICFNGSSFFLQVKSVFLRQLHFDKGVFGKWKSIQTIWYLMIGNRTWSQASLQLCIWAVSPLFSTFMALHPLVGPMDLASHTEMTPTISEIPTTLPSCHPLAVPLKLKSTIITIAQIPPIYHKTPPAHQSLPEIYQI